MTFQETVGFIGAAGLTHQNGHSSGIYASNTRPIGTTVATTASSSPGANTGTSASAGTVTGTSTGTNYTSNTTSTTTATSRFAQNARSNNINNNTTFDTVDNFNFNSNSSNANTLNAPHIFTSSVAPTATPSSLPQSSLSSSSSSVFHTYFPAKQRDDTFAFGINPLPAYDSTNARSFTQNFKYSGGPHSHRQSHSSSKLPAFRFADLKSSQLDRAQQSLHEPPTASCDTIRAVPKTVNRTEIQRPEPDIASRIYSHLPDSATAAVASPSPQPLSPHLRATIQHLTTSPTVVNLSERYTADSYFHPSSVAGGQPGDPRATSTSTNPSTLNTSVTNEAKSVDATRITPPRPQQPTSPDSGFSTRSDEGLGPVKSVNERQRELLLPRPSTHTSPLDERQQPIYRPPPVSYKPPALTSPTHSGSSTPIRVPPIRAFRSSISRRSTGLDMNIRVRSQDASEDGNSSTRDDTLRALEGEVAPITSTAFSPDATPLAGPEGDDTGDVFLKIAREEFAKQTPGRKISPDAEGTARPFRASHRRPLSTAVAAYRTISPPRLDRRLSDQAETNRASAFDDDHTSIISRTATLRALAREKAASTLSGDDTRRAQTSASLRPSPLTPRNLSYQESNSESSQAKRRRPSVTDSVPPPSRGSAFKSPTTQNSHQKSYHPSPLVRAFEASGPGYSETPGAVEGTASTTSTTAPSTVWDELDDMKSRIHRLELTGKIPPTSAAAVSRMSDERPQTANTTATTISSSPKNAAAIRTTESQSPTYSQRDAHPLLVSALTKSKPLLKPEIWRALEAAAQDVIELSALMGQPGYSGPISSGASTIGTNGTITDRQLRRKADSVCRGLTELCLALGEDGAKVKLATMPPQTNTIARNEVPLTPTIGKTFGSTASQLRQSAVTDQEAPNANPSPRTLSKFEERRNNLLQGSAATSPRVTQTPPKPTSAPLAVPIIQPESNHVRRSSLMVSRSRRAGTEELDDERLAAHLRTRRAGTEEPDGGRKTSLLMRNRRGTVGEEDFEARFRAPSRAITEVHTTRAVGRDLSAQNLVLSTETSAPANSVIPRRRFASSSVQPSRVSAPVATPTSTSVRPTRRYADRSGSDYLMDGRSDRPVDERAPRQPMMGNSNVFVNRSSTLSTRRNRDSSILQAPVATTQNYH